MRVRLSTASQLSVCLHRCHLPERFIIAAIISITLILCLYLSSPLLLEAHEPFFGSKNNQLEEIYRPTIIESDGGAELARLCSSGTRAWDPNLIAECPHSEGGFGNIRLSLLNCVRWAIEAKVSIKLATISRRSTEDLTDYKTKDHVELEYLIDEQHFRNQLRIHCPELNVHAPNYSDPTIRRLQPLDPVLDLPLSRQVPYGLERWSWFTMPTAPEQWPDAMDKWINTTTFDQPASAESPIIFELRGTNFNWPVIHDQPALVRQFSDLVRPRSDVQQLAAAALQIMQDTFNINVNFRAPYEPVAPDNSYVGVHLRVEKDASDYKFLSYEEHAKYILKRLNQTRQHSKSFRDPDLPTIDPTVVYVASGNVTGIELLRADLAPATIVTKYDLLPEGSYLGQALDNMTWDQQAMVDMLILEKSGYFFGSRDSSLSWYIALRRAAAVNWIVGGYPKHCWLDFFGRKHRAGCRSLLADDEEWRDNLSTLIGRAHVPLALQFSRMVWP